MRRAWSSNQREVRPVQRQWQQLTRTCTHALAAERRSTLRITTIQSQADDDDDAPTNIALFMGAYVFQSTASHSHALMTMFILRKRHDVSLI